jgi:UPF0755 protein
VTKTPFYKNRRFWLVIVVFILLLAAVGGYFYNKIANTKIVLSDDVSSQFFIKTGQTYPDVLHNLVQSGLVTDEAMFDFLARRANYNNKVKPGRYTFKKGQTYIDVIRQLRSGKQDEVKVVINAMITARQLASIVGSNLEADSITLINMLEDSVYLKGYGFNKETALCMFVPNTYNFYWNTTALDFMLRMKKEYNKYWDDTRKQKAAAQGLTPIEAGVLASIVDGETNKVDEMGIVAGLYLNRLKKGMLLQADPTVKFALRGMGIKRVLNVHTKIESPYNTYLHTGLPPGPLALPSQQAITAVLNPSQHNYIYMCAKEDFSGYHNFTDNLAQHNLNAARYRLMLDKMGIR